MDNIVTYSLRGKQWNSSVYYRDISKFTDIVVSRAENMLGETVRDLMNFIMDINREELRTQMEYYLDVFTMGVLLKAHGRKIPDKRTLPLRLQRKLSKERLKNPRAKGVVDLLRGILATGFMTDEAIPVW